MEEAYGLNLTARLNGNGVLYINSDHDFYRAGQEGSYPWMNEKNRIRKIILGPDVTRFSGVDNNRSLPDSTEKYLTGIPEAFQFCRNLEEVTIESTSLYMAGDDFFPGRYLSKKGPLFSECGCEPRDNILKRLVCRHTLGQGREDLHAGENACQI